MIQRGASVTHSTTTVASISDHSARGLTVGHLRAFIEQADLAGMTDKTAVRLKDELQSTSHWHTVTIRSEVKDSTTDGIATEAPADVEIGGQEHG